MLLVGHRFVLGRSYYSVVKSSLLFVHCWLWLTVILVTLTVKSIVTCYMYVVNFKRHEFSRIFEDLVL
jgi:hypothetical protein